MGMDLVALNPTRPDAANYHVNWTGWGILGDLLIELGCDITEMAGSNDGEEVSALTAAAWGTALVKQMDSIVIERHPSPLYDGGYQERFRVEGSATPVLMSSTDQVRAIIAAAAPTLDRMRRELEGPADDTPPQIVRLSDNPEALHWIQSFADFCLHSGGFEQY